MRALTSLDSMFLAAEDGRTTANVSSLAILDRCDADGKPLTRKDIQELFAERLHLLPPLRWCLADVPLGVGHPWWVDRGGDVDLDFHVRETAVVSPGDRGALETLVARLSAHPMDRSRPLWEVYLIHGLQDGRVALLTKLHHAAVDGLSGGEVLDILFDPTAEGRASVPMPSYRREKEPGQLALLARAIAGVPARQVQTVKAAGRALTHLDQVATLRSIPAVGAAGRVFRRISSPGTGRRVVLDKSLPKAPKLAFNGKITPHRRVALTSVALDDVKAIKNHFDATINDVVVALTAGALRRWLTDQDQLPDLPLVAAVPVSVRAQAELGTYGNRVGTMLAVLPTDEPDPVGRLRRCRTELRAAKERHQAVPPSLMRDANDLIPPILFDRAVRAMTGVAASDALSPAANLVISNVPGPRAPLYCAGRQIHEHYPVSTISDSLGLNVTVFSYVDRLEIGLVGDRDLVADLPGLADAFDKELQVFMHALHESESGPS
ncbi:wax ester/triacylglycerol synthase family O-acyltransferase [Mycobacterium sp. Y57]|uniref:WS/DGAT/MGAT family O-acyltransferase n=1 Tax=Mycolicibacterium xanthum TaxID=2796469 RepID=UPI001C8602D4|nr:wax ester/triacylglycerol synthase family O-acyltransferase [Mycolicibacterium xanthum]MBX7433963.1 wax ester/triacylglycerol synthase family O-acyltransferase [Mycolicibacterium xanthum]